MSQNKLIIIAACFICFSAGYFLKKPEQIVEIKKEYIRQENNKIVTENIKSSTKKDGTVDLTIERVIKDSSTIEAEKKKEIESKPDSRYFVSAIAMLESGQFKYGAAFMMKLPVLPIYAGAGFIPLSNTPLMLQLGVNF